MRRFTEYTSKVSAKGQITIPVEVQRSLGVGPNDFVVFRLVEGKIEIEAYGLSLENAFGAVPTLNNPENFQQLRDIAIEEHVERVAQIRARK